MKTNIVPNFTLKQEVLEKLKDTVTIALVSRDSGVAVRALERQISTNHKFLTHYNVLFAISEHLGTPINELVERVA
ncbi:hypothetical protein [Tenacibaculum piscium]|uniref:hypothetical protein n=1 Tax=Tenacibaculum piscium TaxID=1458515 RepID=UPI001F4452EE|nr:hypothetical protein [Tenacibaculum piscium]